MNFILPLAVGAVCGALAGCGVGGGSLLLLYLTAVTKMRYGHSKLLNLLFFIVCAALALLSHLKNHMIDKKTAMWCIVPGAFTALAFSLLSGMLKSNLLGKIFAVFFIVAGVRELLSRSEAKD